MIARTPVDLKVGGWVVVLGPKAAVAAKVVEVAAEGRCTVRMFGGEPITLEVGTDDTWTSWEIRGDLVVFLPEHDPCTLARAWARGRGAEIRGIRADVDLDANDALTWSVDVVVGDDPPTTLCIPDHYPEGVWVSTEGT